VELEKITHSLNAGLATVVRRSGLDGSSPRASLYGTL
jgi:hypothetical protein